MKLKQQPTDFQVVEVTDVQPSAGRFALYSLRKRHWTTLDALAAIRHAWKLPPHRISFGGLKDRHADTQQYLTIDAGPRRAFRGQGFELVYLGQIAEPFHSGQIRANRFVITLRDIAPAVMPPVDNALAELARDGVPNYFDDQRFGSVVGNEFVGRMLCRGKFESALKLALTGPYEFDRPEDRREKDLLVAHWGQWRELLQRLPNGHARDLIGHLTQRPDDFRTCIERLRPDLQGLYLSAYQSYLWNALLGEWLTARLPPGQWRPIRTRLALLPFAHTLSESQHQSLLAATLPLPSARLKWDETADWSTPLQTVLDREGLALKEIRVPGVRKPFFSRGDRAVWSQPREFGHDWANDDRTPGRQKLTLRFDLNRGSYATLIVKRLQHAAGVEAE